MLAADGGDLDRLADALRVDGVVVDQAMGSGEAEQAHDRIAEIVRETPFPVYVALLEDTHGVSGESVDVNEALAGLLHRRLGDEQAFFVVDTPDGIPAVVSYGLGVESSLFSYRYADRDQLDAALHDAVVDTLGHGASTPSVVLAELWAERADDYVSAEREGDGGVDDLPPLTAEEVDGLVDLAVPLVVRDDWRPEHTSFVDVRPASTGFTAVVSLLTGVVVALLLGQTLRGWPRRRTATRRPEVTPRGPRVPEVDPVRSRAGALLDALTHELAAADPDDLDRDLVDAADAARAAAEMLIDSDEVGDLLGVQALALTGRADLRRARRPRVAAYRPCFFDLGHGIAGHAVGWRLGQGTVEVPCCRQCRTDVRAGRTPSMLHLPGRRGPEPYWEREDVWARTGFGAVTDSLARDVLRHLEDAR